MIVAYTPTITERTSNSAAVAATDVEFLDRGAYTDEEGREISYAVWLENGQLQADVAIFDPTTGDVLDMWLENENFQFEGMQEGEPFSDWNPPRPSSTPRQTPRHVSAGWRSCASVRW